MYKFCLIILVAILQLQINLSHANRVPNSADVFSDVEFQRKLIECQGYCAKQDPKHNAEQTCKVFPERKLVLTDCELQCLQFTKEEISKASTCPCVSGKCVGDTKPPASSAIKYVPMMFSLLIVMYTINYII